MRFVELCENRRYFSNPVAPLATANIRPKIGSISATPNQVFKGASVTLIAAGATDSDGSVARVEFYRDANGNGVFDKSLDTFLGADSSPRRGYRATLDTSRFGIGKAAVFARVRDNVGSSSRVVAGKITVKAQLNLRGDYEGSVNFDNGDADLLGATITRQTGQSFFHGVAMQTGAGVDFSFDGTVGKDTSISIVYAGDFTGKGNGAVSINGKIITGTFKTKGADGKTYTGKFSLHRI
jgi:hypothetical protein